VPSIGQTLNGCVELAQIQLARDLPKRPRRMVFINQCLYVDRAHYQRLPIDLNATSSFLLFCHALAYRISKHFNI
jgi:hypothetical protein